jgi:phosphate starvation-inducible PhoH-like protein
MLTGDPGQIDFPRRISYGVKEVLLILKDTKEFKIIYLDDKDVIRHPLVKKVIEAYKSIAHEN